MSNDKNDLTNDEIHDKILIALLKQQVEQLTARIDQHILDYKTSLSAIQTTQTQIFEELKTFNTTIRTGKWIFATILLIVGAIGQKSLGVILDFFNK